jgi:hypothetical protein
VEHLDGGAVVHNVICQELVSLDPSLWSQKASHELHRASRGCCPQARLILVYEYSGTFIHPSADKMIIIPRAWKIVLTEKNEAQLASFLTTWTRPLRLQLS